MFLYSIHSHLLTTLIHGIDVVFLGWSDTGLSNLIKSVRLLGGCHAHYCYIINLNNEIGYLFLMKENQTWLEILWFLSWFSSST